MAQYDTIRAGSAFRENSFVLLDDYGKNTMVDLLVKGDVVYLFDSQSKVLLKEILVMRDFSVEAGSTPRTVVLRDETKEVILQASNESSKKNCVENLQQLLSSLLPSSNVEQDEASPYHAEPVTVVFRRPQPPSITSTLSSTAKQKSFPPPPIAPKPSKFATLPRPHTKPGSAPEYNIPIATGTVKAISRDLEKVLFTNPFPPAPSRNVNQYPIEEKAADQVEEPETEEYESLNTTSSHPPRLPIPSRVPSDPIMLDDAASVSEMKTDWPSPVTTNEQPRQTLFDDELERLYDNETEFSRDGQDSLRFEETITMRCDSNFPANQSNRISDLRVTEDDADMYASNIEIRRPWLMHGHPTRQEAVKALKGKPDGSFVVRTRDAPNANTFPYALTVLYRDQPIHIQIQRTEESDLVLAPWKAGEKAFETLDDLVQYYRDNRLAFVYHNVQGFVSLQKENFSMIDYARAVCLD